MRSRLHVWQSYPQYFWRMACNKNPSEFWNFQNICFLKYPASIFVQHMFFSNYHWWLESKFACCPLHAFQRPVVHPVVLLEVIHFVRWLYVLDTVGIIFRPSCRGACELWSAQQQQAPTITSARNQFLLLNGPQSCETVMVAMIVTVILMKWCT
jgi:hypothetical protein